MGTRQKRAELEALPYIWSQATALRSLASVAQCSMRFSLEQSAGVPPMPDPLSERYRELLEGSYDCVDRIVLNAYFRMGHSAGGFRTWWRQLTGSEETLDNTHLMRLAGRFSRRLRAFAQAKGIPVVDCRRGERKHEIAEQYLTSHTGRPGLFLILVSKAQAPVWEVSGKHHLEWKGPPTLCKPLFVSHLGPGLGARDH